MWDDICELCFFLLLLPFQAFEIRQEYMHIAHMNKNKVKKKRGKQMANKQIGMPKRQ